MLSSPEFSFEAFLGVVGSLLVGGWIGLYCEQSEDDVVKSGRTSCGLDPECAVPRPGSGCGSSVCESNASSSRENLGMSGGGCCVLLSSLSST